MSSPRLQFSWTHTRKFLVVLLVVAVPSIGISLLFGWVNGWKWTPDGKSAATSWIITSCLHFVVCSALALWQLKRIRHDLNEYFNDFYDDKVMPTTESPSKPSAEGQSSLLVIVWGIYGLAAFIGSILLYFAFAQAWNPSDFIFSNNEGFVAALALLIIVLSGAIVPIYTDLAKQVRQQMDTFELEISSLCQTVAEIDVHATALWVHFERIARPSLADWARNVTQENIAGASFDVLFKPVQVAQHLGQKFPHYRDETTAKFLENLKDESIGDQIDLGQYKTAIDLQASKTRIQSMFKRDLNEEVLDSQSRIDRSRRLKYLGWASQGPLAIASPPNGIRTYVSFAQNKLEFIRIPTSSTDESQSKHIFANNTKFLTPPSEHFFVYVLRRQQASSNESQKPFANVRDAQVEFKERSARHLQKWDSVAEVAQDSSLRTSLRNACFPLEVDLSFFSDDVTLFSHLALKSDDEPETPRFGIPARFLYFAFWAIAPAHKTTSQKILRTITKNDMPFLEDIYPRFLDIYDNLEAWVNEDCPDDPMSTLYGEYEGLLPVAKDFDRIVDFVEISTKWVAEVKQQFKQVFYFGNSLMSRTRVSRFLTMLDNVRLEDVDDRPEETVDERNEAIFRFISPFYRHRQTHGEYSALDSESPDVEFTKVIQRIQNYCIDSANRGYFIETFFGRNDSPATPEEQYDTWLTESRKKIVSPKNIPQQVVPRQANVTQEFLVLSLADHRSALYNWVRAARSRKTRDHIKIFKLKLVGLKPAKQFGIDVIPSRQDQIQHLHRFIQVREQPKPLSPRSTFDLEPTKSQIVATKYLNKLATYRRYLDLIDYLEISTSFRKDVAIPQDVQMKIFDALDGDKKPLDVDLAEKPAAFVRWLCSVLVVRESEKEKLLIALFKMIMNQPSQESKEKIRKYCVVPANEKDMQDTFFGGNDPASAAQAPEKYNLWLEKFKERNPPPQEDETSEPDS